MNLIARCPACQTSYRVVPDQLRVSDGWVRCGHCAEVFDASVQLVDAEIEPSVADPRVPEDDQVQAHPLMPDAPDEPPWASAALLIKPSSDSETEVEESAQPVPLPTETPVSFMRALDGSTDEPRRSRSFLWWGLGAVLLFCLLLQVLYRERDQLAAFAPELKPALQAVCDVLDCHIAPVQRIEDLVIDSAEFHQLGRETFELRFVVKNKARFELALPAIELTMTDMADRPVLRRVFTSVDLGANKQGSVAAGAVWSASVYLRVSAEASGVRALGYRLLAFYP
ncbi:MAG: zinc-ribbon and DUF3426 domain-containing protein [Rhodoferax sp.]|nr:zinc-ribbon and DUF3426 domain-containing protein [Rhodoferax sp.]